NRPPSWPKRTKEYQNDSIVLTEAGWTVLRTGEVLVAMGGRLSDAGVSDVIGASIVPAGAYNGGDLLRIKVVFNEKVDVDAGATILVLWDGPGGNFTCEVPADLLGVYEVQFEGMIPFGGGNLTLSGACVITGTILDAGTGTPSNLWSPHLESN
ncbi:hypothetical protein EBU71_06360, partial [bacterium]|nr:hypothetical protein [Candidatus Elulimicrobium humile]